MESKRSHKLSCKEVGTDQNIVRLRIRVGLSGKDLDMQDLKSVQDAQKRLQTGTRKLDQERRGHVCEAPAQFPPSHTHP